MNRYICPECKGEPLKEQNNGFTICGLCKGERSVDSIDESYHESSGIFKRVWIDVVRIRAIENDRSEKFENDMLKLEKYHQTHFLGYRPFYKTLIQNDINHS